MSGQAGNGAEALVRQLMSDGPISLREMRLRAAAAGVSRRDLDGALSTFRVVRYWDIARGLRFVTLRLPGQTLPTPAGLAAEAFHAEFGDVGRATAPGSAADTFGVRLVISRRCANCGVPLPKGRWVAGRPTSDMTGGTTEYSHGGDCPPRPTKHTPAKQSNPTREVRVWPGLLALGLAGLIAWGAANSLTYEEWQAIDWGFIAGSTVLAGHFVISEGGARAWITVGISVLVFAGVTVARWDLAMWAVVDGLAITSMLAIAAMTVLAAREARGAPAR